LLDKRFEKREFSAMKTIITPTKACRVTLRDGRELIIEAPSYHKDGDQYVFEVDGSSEIQFVDTAEVVSITVESVNRGRDGRGW